MTLANGITLARILAVPLILILMPTPWLAVLAFSLISLTDMIDGMVARRMNQVTTLGKLLDPLADKILVITLLLFYVAHARIAYYWVAIIIVRELAVSGLRTLAALEKRIIKADQLGKAKTVWQYITIIWMMLAWPGETLLIAVMILLTLASGINYFWVNKEVLKNG